MHMFLLENFQATISKFKPFLEQKQNLVHVGEIHVVDDQRGKAQKEKSNTITKKTPKLLDPDKSVLDPD